MGEEWETLKCHSIIKNDAVNSIVLAVDFMHCIDPQSPFITSSKHEYWVIEPCSSMTLSSREEACTAPAPFPLYWEIHQHFKYHYSWS